MCLYLPLVKVLTLDGICVFLGSIDPDALFDTFYSFRPLVVG